MQKIEDHDLEKVPLPKKEPFIKSILSFAKRELRYILDGMKDGLIDPLILLKRIFLPKSVDKRVRKQADWFNVEPENPNGRAVLLCHGFASTPATFFELAPILADAGYHVRAIRLSGHGTTIEHLAQTTAADWFASVLWHYKELSKTYQHISFIGHSLGGTLGLLLSTIYPIETIACLATPVKLNIPPAVFVREASILVKYWPKSSKKRQRYSDLGLYSYKFDPLFAIGGIFDATKILRDRAQYLELPILYIRAAQDHKSLLEQPDEFKKYFPDANVEFRDAENSPHTMLLGPERDMICDWLIKWLNENP